MNFSEMINGIGSPNRPEYEVYTPQGLLFTTPSRRRKRLRCFWTIRKGEYGQR